MCYDTDMGYFKREGRDNRGGGRGFGGGRDRGRRDDRSSFRSNAPREMFKTTCSNCGKECEVPFKPTTGKPVYCSDCFEKMGGRNSDSRSERPERNRPDFSNRPQSSMVDYSKQFEDLRSNIDAINRKMDKVIELLTPKSEEKVAKASKVKKVKVAKEE